jgi:hypothetical protein
MPNKSVAVVRTKVMACRECGCPLTVGSNARKAPKCIECGVTALADTARQMVSKSGPKYEKWLASMRKALKDA